jgi:V8-like Glu-specific endopeptidase
MSLQSLFSSRRRSGLIATMVACVAVTAYFATSIATASGAAGAAPVQRAAAPPAGITPPGLISHTITQSPAQTLAYWTPARMAGAVPVQTPVRNDTPHSVSPQIQTGTPGKASSWSPPGLYEGPSVATAQQEPAAGASPQTQCQYCYIPYTRYFYFAKYRTYPISTIGKLFFTNDGKNYVCSASVIYTNTLDTAGHCVANTDGTHLWDSSALFCPSYNAGVNSAVGCWAANYFVTWDQWKTAGSFEWDFGGINTSTCGTVWCTPIANRTGYLGVAWNQGEDQNFTAFGYPQASPFDGNYIVVCQSEFGYETSDGNNQGGPNSIAIGCDMTGGSSGGPWIIGFGSGNWVNGHNDWKWNSLPQAMNSPYVDTRDCQVWKSAGRTDITC